jgi:hypothetical protein
VLTGTAMEQAGSGGSEGDESKKQESQPAPPPQPESHPQQLARAA